MVTVQIANSVGNRSPLKMAYDCATKLSDARNARGKSLSCPHLKLQGRMVNTSQGTKVVASATVSTVLNVLILMRCLKCNALCGEF